MYILIVLCILFASFKEHQMFKKSSESSELNIFTSPKYMFSGNSLKMYEDNRSWHNQFRTQVTMRIDENIFRPLYCEDNGTPNAPVRVLVAMMVLKEAEGLSDQKIFENCRFNLLVRSAIGLHNADDPLPTESTYYLFRKRIMEHAKEKGENLFETAFAQITKGQCAEFEVSGKRIRMDSKLMGSNIAWLSRYELVHETVRLFYDQAKQWGKLDKVTRERLDGLLKLEGNKVVYTCSSEEVKSRLQELGRLIYKILHHFRTRQVHITKPSGGFSTSSTGSMRKRWSFPAKKKRYQPNRSSRHTIQTVIIEIKTDKR